MKALQWNWRNGHKSYDRRNELKHDGTPYAVKIARTVWSGGKLSDYLKELPITIVYAALGEIYRLKPSNNGIELEKMRLPQRFEH